MMHYRRYLFPVRIGIPAILVVLVLTSSPSRGADSADVLSTTATDLSNGLNYLITTILPLSATTTDVQLSGTYISPTLTVGGAALNFGTLNDLNTTQGMVITNTSALGASITLNSAANSTTGANASDLLYVKAGGLLTLQAGTGGLTLNLLTSGSVHNDGTLNVSSPLSIAALTTASFTGAGATTVSGNIAALLGSVNVATTGGGTVTLSGNNGYIGNTSITSGTLNAANIVVSSGVSNIGNAITAVTLGGAATKGLLNYTGNSATYTRGLVVSGGGGEVDVATANQLLTINTGNVVTGSGLFTIGGVGNTAIASVIGGGSGGLAKTASGTLSLSGANTYAGPTTISGGVVQISAAANLGNASASNTLALSGGTLASTANSYALGATRAIALTGTGTLEADAGNLTVNGVVSGTGTLTKAGTGTVTLAGANTALSGNVQINAGTLALANTAALNANTAVSLGLGGILDLNGTPTETIANLSGSAGVVTNTSVTPAVLTLNGSVNASFGGTIADQMCPAAVLGLNINLAASATQTLSGSNTYTGISTVASGTLQLGNVNALGNGGIVNTIGTGGTTVQAGGTVDLNGQANINEVLTLNGTGSGGNGALVNSNAAATATIGNGVSSINVSGTFTGLNANTTVTIGAPAGGGTNATASAVLGVSNQSFTINSGLALYLIAPTVTIGGGTGATAVANLNVLGAVVSITITNPGCGFTTVPTITFSGGSLLTVGTGPTGVGVDGHFVLDGVQVTGNGSGYVTVPTVSVSSGAVTTSANLTAVTLASTASVGGSGNIAINPVISGTGGLTKVGSGTVTLNAGETYTGGTTVSGGTLSVGVANALATSTGVNVTVGANLALGANNTSVNGNVTLTNGSITGTGTLTAAGVNPSITVGNGSISANLAGVGASLTKSSDGSGAGGTVTLTGVNTYTGPTQVNAGTLEVDGSISSSGVTVGGATASGSPLLTGIGTIAGTLTISAANGGAAGILNPGMVGAIGTLTVGNINFQGGSTLVMDLSGNASDLLKVNQVANIASGTGIQLNAANLTLGSYTLVTAASGLNGNLLNVIGSLPSGYAIVQTATSIDLQHISDQAFAAANGSTISIITGSTTTVSATLNNNAPVGSQGLTISLSDNGGTGGVVSGFISSGGSDIPAGSSTTVSATFTAGQVGTNETWSFKNTDNNAVPAVVTVTGPVNVLNHATPVLTVTAGNNQSVFVGGTLTTPAATLADTIGVVPVGLDVSGLSNLTGATGLGVIPTGTSATYIGAALNSTVAGIGKTEVLSLVTGDQQTVIGANPLSMLSQTVTYNVFNHATPTLSLTSSNNAAAFVGGALGTVTVTLADPGNAPAPLDVGTTLTNLTGATGSNVVASGGSALYNVTGFNTTTAGLGKVVATGLTAGDTQTITGANPLTALAQNVIYNVYNHATPTLAIASGNNQSVFVNGTFASATLTLSDNGSAPAPLDVGSLSNLTGTTGSAVIATGGSGIYTATGFDSTVTGIGKTLTTSLATGDQQTIPGANPLGTLTEGIVYNVYNHSAPVLAVTSGNNQSVFLNGTLTAATLTLSNPGNNSVPVDVASLSNLSGATGSGVVEPGTTETYTASGFNTGTVGIGKTLSTGLLAGDQQIVPGANPLTSLGQTLTYNVFNHATSSLTGGTFNLGIMHVGYTAPVISANSLTATNGAVGDDRVNLQGSAPAAGNISVNSLSGIASGASGAISATLATGQGVGAINTPLTYTFADQSAIAGALSNVGTATLTVTGLVYSGQSAWTGNGTAQASWGTLVSNFGTNWGLNQGSPGLDSGFATTDTAAFGNVGGQAAQVVTLDGANPSLNSLTFDASSTSYNIAQGSGGTISLNGGAGSATITDVTTGGTQTISAPTGLVTTTNINVAANDVLTISGVMSGTGGITLTGDGVVVLNGNNTYTGTTVVDPGTLMINGMTAPSGNVVVQNGATLSGSGSTGNVTVQGGGHINLQDGAIDTLTVSSLTIGAAGNPSSISFDIGSGSALDGIIDHGALTFTGTGGTVITIGNVSGTPTLADGLFHLITSTGITGDLTDLTLSQTALDGKTLSLEINGTSLDLLIGDLTGATTYSLTASAANGRIIVGTGTTTLTSTLTNSGAADSVNYTALNVSTTGGTLGAGVLPQNGGPVAPGTTSSGTRFLDAGNSTGVITITPTVGSATNMTFGGNAVLDGTTTATVDVVDNRVVTASTVTLGRVVVGQAVNGTSTLSTTGDDAHFTRVTVGSTGPDANGISATGGNNEVFNGANVTDTRTVGGTFTTAGSVMGTLTLTATGEGLAGESPTNVSLSYSADPVNKRVITVGAVTALGEVHTGSTVNITTNPFTTTGTHDTTTDVMVAAGSGVADANGLALSGTATTFNGGVSSDTRTLSGTIVNANGGVTTGTFNLAVMSLENGGAGLAGEGAYPTLGVSYSAMVYSGQGVYNAPGSGSWGTIQNPTDWTANGGAPGLDPNFTDTDTATFGNSIGDTMATVTLDGDDPSLTAITFDNTDGGTYTIEPGMGGGMITLNNGAGTATITNADGNNTITTPIVLDSNTSFSSGSGDTLTLDGAISDAGGPKSVTVNGPGTVDLGGANTYSGGTTLDSGTLDISGMGTLGATTGTLTVAGGTLDLGGTTQTVGTVTLTGGSSTIQDGTLDGSSYTDTAPSGTQTITATLGGTGGLTMSGGGTLALDGANTYSGGTTINSGTVAVGNPTGLGTGNVTVTGGTLEAGNGNHIIDIGGNYTMTGGTLILTVAGTMPGVAGGYDILHLNGGTATLGGALQINVAPGYIPNGGTTFVFVQGGTTTGSFSSTTSNLGSESLTQTGPTSFTIAQLPFATLQGENYTSNQMSVATDLDVAIRDGASNPNFQILITALNGLTATGTAPDALADAFDQLGMLKFPEFVRTTIFNNASFSTQMFDSLQEGQRSWEGDFLHHRDAIDSSELTVLDPSMDPALAQVGSRMLAYSPAPLAHGLLSDSDDIVMGGVDMTTPAVNATDKGRSFNIFVMGNVVLAQSFSQADLAHADTTTGGVELGVDYLITPHFKVGVMFGFGHTDGTLDNLGSKATLDSYAPGIFASYADKGWYANALASYGFNNYTEDRHVSFGTLSGVAHGAPTGSQVVGNLDGGYDFHSGHWTYGPTAGVQYTHFDVDNFSEGGSDPIDLQVGRENSNSLRSRVGAHVSYVFHTNKITLTPHLDVSWQHEFLDQSQSITSQFTSIGAGGFQNQTPNASRDSALIDAGLSAELNSHISLYLDYIAQAGQSNYFGQSVQAGIKIGF